jgi:DNA-binding NarL/FixJ family response regulator
MANRILIADDHTLVRQALRKLLQNEGFEVVGEASNGFDALSKAQELKPDAVLMDMYMPGLDGVAATRLICRELPEVQVVLLTVSEDEQDIIEAVQAGARGYLLKSTDASTLVKQLKHVLSGGVGVSEDMAAKLVMGLARRGSTSRGSNTDPYATLTEREKDVLGLIAQGASNKAIAASLFISENTVRAHVRSLMQKLNLENRTQLAVYGLREGFLELKGRRSSYKPFEHEGTSSSSNN